MRSLETTEVSSLLFLGSNPELTIGLQGLGQGMRKAPSPSTHTQDKQALLPRPDHAACHLSPIPVYSARIYSRESGSRLQPPPCAAGGLGCVFGWPMHSLSYGRHSRCARACLFTFPPPLVGVELARECGSHSFFFFKRFCLKKQTSWQTSWNNLSHKVPCYKFFMGGRVQVSPGKGRQTETKDMW
jgi:hypothetical protein